MIALDTNLLVYAHRQGSAEHRAARTALESASRDPRGWGIALPCASEFWSVVTHPASAGGPSTPTQALGFLRNLTQWNAMVWMPGTDFWKRLAQLAVDLGVQGPRIFDLQIALISFDNGASELWTHDAGFVSVPGLPLHDPI